MKLRLLAVGLITLAAAAPAGSAGHPVSSFTRPHVIPLAMRSDSLLLADVNHDRHLDLVASTGNRLSPLVLVAFGDGKGHFHRRVTSHVFWADNLSTGDVNGDGNVDLVSSDDLYCPNVQLGDGQGGFAAGAQMPHCFTGSWPPAYLATLGDVTGDGKLDLVWCSNAFAMVLAGDGHGAFQRTSGTPIFGGYPVPYDMDRIVIADVNHDGFGDLVGAGPNGLSVSPGREDGTLGGATTYSFPREPSGWGHGRAEDVAVADLNHDGYGDFLVALAGAEPPDPPGHGRIAVLSGSRSGVLASGPMYSAGRVYLPSSIALGDLNRDGKLDLVVADVGLTRLLSTSRCPRGPLRRSARRRQQEVPDRRSRDRRRSHRGPPARRRPIGRSDDEHLHSRLRRAKALGALFQTSDGGCRDEGCRNGGVRLHHRRDHGFKRE